MQTLKEIAQQARFAAMQPAKVQARNSGDTATIRAKDLSLVLGSIKIRKYSNGETCLLCALSETPTIQLTCSDRYRDRAQAARFGVSPVRVSPLQRGDICRVFDRVASRGRREVLKTFGVGIRALRAEPQYVLMGGGDHDRAMLGIMLGAAG